MPFVSKKEKNKEQKHYTVNDTFGQRKKIGDVGLEIEVEGTKLIKTPPAPWLAHRDGSLRGKENMEYVFDGPVAFDSVDKAIDDLWAAFVKAGATLDDSNRTSVHVHLNVGEFYLNRLTSLMALWFTFEDILTHWCGDNRVGNLFCLRAKDAQGIIATLQRFIANGMETPIHDNHHYANLNANALSKFGSLEVRTLRGVTEPETAKTWVKILRRLYDASAQYADPRRVCETMSYYGADQFLVEILGEYALPIQNTLKWPAQRISNSLYEGVRFAQDLAYARDWDGFKGEVVEKDPWGRSKKKRAAPAGIVAEAAAPQINTFAQFVNQPAPLHPDNEMPIPDGWFDD